MAEKVTENEIPNSNTSMMPKSVNRVISISKILPLVSLLLDLVEIVKISIVIATKTIILIIFIISSGCNIDSKIFLAERGKLPLKLTCPVGPSTCPATLVNKGELHCKDSAQNITCWAGQVRVLFCLPDCHFWQIDLQLAIGQVVLSYLTWRS